MGVGKLQFKETGQKVLTEVTFEQRPEGVRGKDREGIWVYKEMCLAC